MTKKILSIVGARPQFIKAAAVSREIVKTPGLEEIMLHTGQHFDDNMSDVFFRELGIPRPHHYLDIHGGSHGEMTGRMLAEVEAVMLAEKPDIVLIYGDTNSTLAGALAAAKLHIPIAHVEAGLRSFNRAMPEEINRVLADHVSQWLFCPTQTAIRNLEREGIKEGVFHVGDVMYDAALDATHRARQESSILGRLSLAPGDYAVATLHRAENTDTREALVRAIDYLREAAGERQVVLPLHPRTRSAAAWFGVSLDGLTIIDPVGYLDMAAILENCTKVFTDSGGLQKEAYFHRKPCVTLRGETEWVETIAAGWNRLWTEQGEDHERQDIADYGAGHAAHEICTILAGEPL
ncbi:non-hydrolyzing UDP-N-acetylglucosamine 2-epimerase [Shinella zoogloeoides]|uniref:UDP-N-acetylglucosamine 2-epimerase (Non-hydrolyzing) n=1 Tax=Shinella zoogloeoides TaxID=352475 RepID=A0A6N8TNK1_SHIZO|nr:UDP-N-acetylglucosamine 2-epimerase (non-hydrolyzing) [Shinella zoogloeoides]MXO02724.1 UDP-N-acetylglucosamine 2-epimerase (non-hydrolyzing) [Shinella zoogloeoides]UEX81826.1 UDP-N-acetylglucosamine 2-epimerase (non-hydrolyzing) [Shinella zoogloeoides]